MKANLKLPAVAALLSLALPAQAQSVRSGVEAWQNGDAAGAIVIWKPLAARGDADAAFNLGQAYRLGRGAQIDLALAQSYYEQAARQGHVDAATTLGILLFQNGNRTGGLRWLRKSAESGDARAMLLFGTALYNGDGVAPDPVTGYAFISRSAAQGLPAAVATLADLDAAMPLAQRQQGVALAKSMTRPAPATPTASATPAPGKPAPPANAARATAAAKAKAAATPASGAALGKWRIQLGAFSQRSAAEALYARLGGKLAGRSAVYVPAGEVVRLQVGPYDSRASAAAACARLAPQPCFAVEAR